MSDTAAIAEQVRAVHQRLLADVGQRRRFVLGKIDALQTQRYAIAAGDEDSVYFDDAAARRAGYRGIVVPPLYLSSVLGWEAGPPMSELRHDGTAGVEIAGLELEGLRLMGAGQNLEFHAPAYPGDTVTMDLSIESVELKEGRSGAFLLLTLLREYRRVDNTMLAVCRENFIAR